MEVPSARKPAAVDFALLHIRASSGTLPDANGFRRCLASGFVEDGSSTALETHLREADAAELADLVAEGAAIFATLAALAGQLVERDHPNAVYLDEATACSARASTGPWRDGTTGRAGRI